MNRQKAVKKKGPFTDFQEDLIKDLFERCDLFEYLRIYHLFIYPNQVHLHFEVRAMVKDHIPSPSKPDNF